MNLWTLALAYLRRNRLASALNVLLMAIGIATIVLLALFAQQMNQRMSRDAAGVDLVLGAKGSPVQLILSAVYHADVPTGNIDYAEARRWAQHPMVRRAIPQALGDSWRGFRIVGTSHDYPAHYGAAIAEGRLWQAPGEVTVGAEVAAAGMQIGQSFFGVHGFSERGHAHENSEYRVVGVLQATGTVADRLIFTGLESVWAVHGDAAPEAPEITSMLLNYKTPLAATQLPRQINTQSQLQAASPAFETARLLNLVGIGLDGFRLFGWLLVATAGIGIFVALYHALEARRYDLAMMRCLGASRWQVIASLVIEALLLTLAGAVLGLLLGHAAAELLGAVTDERLVLSGAQFLPQELAIVAAALAVGMVAAALPAIRLYRADVARILSEG